MSAAEALEIIEKSIEDIEYSQQVLDQMPRPPSSNASFHTCPLPEKEVEDNSISPVSPASPASPASPISPASEQNCPPADTLSEARKKAIAGLIIFANFVPVGSCASNTGLPVSDVCYRCFPSESALAVGCTSPIF